MAGNFFGKLFKISTFGESHGKAIGVIIDGCPANISIQKEIIQKALDQRKPGKNSYTSTRKEDDKVNILSGIYEGKSLGTPIALLVENKDSKPEDYTWLKNVYRPSHADYTYEKKYGIRDYRGGGRASARETLARVAAGSIAMQFLNQTTDIECLTYVKAIGLVEAKTNHQEISRKSIENNLRCPDPIATSQIIENIHKAKEKGDSLGGVIECVVKNCPVGLGEPVFDKLEAQLAKAMLSIPACKGFEIGSGFEGAKVLGSEHNDIFQNINKKISTKTNNSGGVQGGISNGMDIYFKTAFKPTATILREQNSVTKDGNPTILKAVGRHDPCVVPRAVPIVEAMTYLVLADAFLEKLSNKL